MQLTQLDLCKFSLDTLRDIRIYKGQIIFLGNLKDALNSSIDDINKQVTYLSTFGSDDDIMNLNESFKSIKTIMETFVKELNRYL